MVSSFMPRQDVPETEKDLDMCKKVLDYAISQFDTLQGNRKRIFKLRQSYNGVVDKKRVEYLTKTYGKNVKTKFIDYHLGRSKIDMVNGEWLKRKLNTTVQSENKEAKSEKMKKYYKQLGLAESQKEIAKLKEVVGFDSYDGMEMPQKGDDGKYKVSVKLKNEIFMQHALTFHKRKRKLKTKLAKNFKDLELVSECFGMIEISNDGVVDYTVIKPEDAIYVESLDDDFLEKTPIIGHRRWMFIHDVLNEFSGDEEFQGEAGDELRRKLEDMKNSPSTYWSNEAGASRNYYRQSGNELAVEVFRIEWKSSRPVYTKFYSNGRTAEISPEYYEKHRSKIKNDEKNGKFELRTEWKVELWEATRIGLDMHVRCRRKFNQMRPADSPHDPWYSYTSLLFNTENGLRVSLQAIIDNISFLYNVVMYQINRELAKAKGKVVAYDLAALPRGKTVRDVSHDMAEDGVYYYNSAGEGNKIGRNVTINGVIKEIDLGISRTIEILLPLKVDLQGMVDQLTGISQDRAGQISPSATVTNAQSNIVASRTITEPLFYFMERYAEMVFSRMLQSIKVAWGIMDGPGADMIIGDEGKGFFKASTGIARDDYTAYLIDSKEELEIRETLDFMAQVSVNAKELRVQDWLKVKMSETLGEAEIALNRGWEDLQKARLQASEVKARSVSEKSKVASEMMREDREDRQEHSIQLEYIKQGFEGMKQSQKAEEQLTMDFVKGEQNANKNVKS